MTIETLTAFFGWATVLNLVILAVVSVTLLVFKGGISGIHQRMLGMGEEDLTRLYVTWMGNYKLLVIVFFLVPYLALCLI